MIKCTRAGKKLKYKPGTVIGGRNVVYDCGVSRSIGYFLEPWLSLTHWVVCKRPISIWLKGNDLFFLFNVCYACLCSLFLDWICSNMLDYLVVTEICLLWKAFYSYVIQLNIRKKAKKPWRWGTFALIYWVIEEQKEKSIYFHIFVYKKLYIASPVLYSAWSPRDPDMIKFSCCLVGRSSIVVDFSVGNFCKFKLYSLLCCENLQFPDCHCTKCHEWKRYLHTTIQMRILEA